MFKCIDIYTLAPLILPVPFAGQANSSIYVQHWVFTAYFVVVIYKYICQ